MKRYLSFGWFFALVLVACAPIGTGPRAPTATGAPALTTAGFTATQPIPTTPAIASPGLTAAVPTATRQASATSASTATKPTILPTLQLTTLTPHPATPQAMLTATPALAVPVIHAFTASPAEVAQGQPATLAWNAAAEWVKLTPLDSQGRLTNVSISLPISGTLIVTPEVGYNSQGYILFAGSGDTYTSASVTVRLLCQATWFFPNPPTVCPLSAPHAAAMAAQPFEHGLMLWVDQWTGGSPTILALFSGGVSGRGEWQEWPDQWVAGMPESDPTITPPPGLYEPRRGFGKLWREQVALRDRLGWATSAEAALPQGLWQWDALAKYNSVYITGPGGQVYVLGPEHASWAVWTGAAATP